MRSRRPGAAAAACSPPGTAPATAPRRARRCSASSGARRRTCPRSGACPSTRPARWRRRPAWTWPRGNARPVFKALGEAVGIVRTAGFAADVPLGEVQARMVRGQKIAIHGGDEFEGVLNKVESQGQSLIDPQGLQHQLRQQLHAGGGLRRARARCAQAMLTYGQSSDPASPYAYDQLPLFSAKQWHPLPFHRADIEAQRVGRSPSTRLLRIRMQRRPCPTDRPGRGPAAGAGLRPLLLPAPRPDRSAMRSASSRRPTSR